MTMQYVYTLIDMLFGTIESRKKTTTFVTKQRHN